MSEQLYVTIVDTKGETLVSDLETDWIPPRGTRIDWQHEQPFVIGVVRAVKWTSHNGVTILLAPHEATIGPNEWTAEEREDPRT